MQQLEKFQQILDQRQMAREQKELWLKGFKFLPPESIESFLEVIVILTDEELNSYTLILEKRFKQAAK